MKKNDSAEFGSVHPVPLLSRDADDAMDDALREAIQDLRARLELVCRQPMFSNGAHASVMARTLRYLRAALNSMHDAANLSAAFDGGFLTRLETLSTRERQVMTLVVKGLANKEIAARLGLNRRTVEHHRARVMRKMAARSFADLVRMSVVGDQAVPPPQRDGRREIV